MSLSGNLGFVSLDEVLRLLTRSEQQGSVDVSGEGVRGRIFVTNGGIALATTADDSSLRQHLIKSGLVDETYMQSVESGQASFAPTAEDTGGGLVQLLREMSVESIYQMGLKGDAFEVSEGLSTRFASPEIFELEQLLDDSRQRLTEWTDVSRTVSDLDAPLFFRTDLGDREDVKIDRDGWRVLSHVGSESTVSDLAERLGTTEFWTARAAANLMNQDLLEIGGAQTEESAAIETPEWESATPETAESSSPDESWWEEPGDESEEPADHEAESVATDVFEGAEEPSPVAESEPVEDEYVEAADEEAEETDEESLIPAIAEASDTADVEEDTEAFLEKVFSELDSPPEEPSSQDEGHGLLRRRRLGAIRDISGDA
ncbi:MAG: DUF4388 domain-containing protein [Actinomycetota bacterium]|nr:DUF4388 domain-containing protein [Actinomycetota bacterium]